MPRGRAVDLRSVPTSPCVRADVRLAHVVAEDDEDVRLAAVARGPRPGNLRAPPATGISVTRRPPGLIRRRGHLKPTSAAPWCETGSRPDESSQPIVAPMASVPTDNPDPHHLHLPVHPPCLPGWMNDFPITFMSSMTSRAAQFRGVRACRRSALAYPSRSASVGTMVRPCSAPSCISASGNRRGCRTPHRPAAITCVMRPACPARRPRDRFPELASPLAVAHPYFNLPRLPTTCSGGMP